MILLDLAGTRPYVYSQERALPPEEQTWWMIRDLEEREQIRVIDSISAKLDLETGETRVGGSGTRIYWTLKAALLGTDPDHPAFVLVKGEKVRFEFTYEKDGTVSDETLARIPYAVKQELYAAIQNRITMTEEEVGKSAAQPSAQPLPEPPAPPSPVAQPTAEECAPSSST